MGMYDTITCDMALPDNWDNEHFQTKSLDCALNMYHISSDGKLLRKHNAGVYMPEIYTGEIRFYSFEGTNHLADDYEWHEYIALFLKGKCIEIAQYE